MIFLILVGWVFVVPPMAMIAFTHDAAKSNKWWIRMFSLPSRWNLNAVLLFVMMIMFLFTCFSFLVRVAALQGAC